MLEENDILNLPYILTNAIKLERKELKELYNKSSYSIIEQYIEESCKKEKWKDLFTLINLEHYDVSRKQINRGIEFYNSIVEAEEQINSERDVMENSEEHYNRLNEKLTFMSPKAKALCTINKPKERFKFLGVGYIMLLKDNKILLQKRYNTGYADGMYSLPSGHIEKNESVAYATKREAEEETGIKIDEQDIKLFTIIQRETEIGTYFDFFSVSDRWEGNPYIAEPNKCSEVKWCDINKLPSNILPYVKVAIINYINNKKLHIEYYKDIGAIIAESQKEITQETE